MASFLLRRLLQAALTVLGVLGANWKPRPDGLLIFRDAAWEN